MKLAIIKYNAGNIQSVTYAFERLGITPILTDNPEEILSADKVLFPGVGEASTTMKSLRNTGLDVLIPQLKQPVLGICLGMQLMCTYSEENDTQCLGIFDNQVRKFHSPDRAHKVPHMGWNTLTETQTPLYQGLPEDPYVYFVHSYYAEISHDTAAVTDYIHPFSAGLHKDNFYAAQFHPEKSGDIGSKILQNFIEMI